MDKLRRIQLMQLDLAKEVHKICVKNNLKYVMLSGTLLGAVRHKGFIPWDDDLDIGLPREDYEKLMKILKKSPIPGCFLQTFDTDAHYVQPYAKIRIDNTKYIESYWQGIPMHQGIFIDIFPLDKIPKPGSKTAELRRILCKELTFSIWRKEHCHIKRRGIKKLEAILSSVIGLLPKSLLVSWQNSLANMEKKSWKYRSSIYTSNYDTNRVFYRDDEFDRLTLYDFEDTQLYGPEDYDTHLKRLFKSYMDYPPVEKRNSGHNVVEIKL